MPHYHFNVHDGKDMLNDEEIELPNVDSAREVAVRLFGSVLRNDAFLIALGADRCMAVTDQTGLVLFRLGVTVEASAAAKMLRYQA